MPQPGAPRPVSGCALPCRALTCSSRAHTPLGAGHQGHPGRRGGAVQRHRHVARRQRRRCDGGGRGGEARARVLRDTQVPRAGAGVPPLGRMRCAQCTERTGFAEHTAPCAACRLHRSRSCPPSAGSHLAAPLPPHAPPYPLPRDAHLPPRSSPAFPLAPTAPTASPLFAIPPPPQLDSITHNELGDPAALARLPPGTRPPPAVGKASADGALLPRAGGEGQRAQGRQHPPLSMWREQPSALA